MEEETHKNKLSLLCFVCGEFFKKSFHVSTHLKNLRKAFYIYDETSYSDENIYPQKFCRKCYLKLMNILKRKTTTTPISIPVWEKHTPGLCKVCTVERDTKGGKRKKIKIKSVGRPSSTKETLWTRKRSDDLQASTPNLVPGFNEISAQVKIPEHLNPQLPHCKCKICSKILFKPVKLRNCEEQFCLGCILPKLEGRSLDELKCPQCGDTIQFQDVSVSCILNSLISSLRLICIKGCNFIENIQNFKSMLRHQNDCQGNIKKNILSVDDMMKLSSNNIPIEAEKAAANVIKLKMKKEGSIGTMRVSLPTGGHVSAIIPFFFFYK